MRPAAGADAAMDHFLRDAGTAYAQHAAGRSTLEQRLGLMRCAHRIGAAKDKHGWQSPEVIEAEQQRDLYRATCPPMWEYAWAFADWEE